MCVCLCVDSASVCGIMLTTSELMSSVYGFILAGLNFFSDKKKPEENIQ